MCVDLPDKPFLRIGAKYRLLGRSPVPEVHNDDVQWSSSSTAKRLKVEKNGSGLYGRLCGSVGNNGSCEYPALVVLDANLECAANSKASECRADTVRVVQVDGLYYEYIRAPCVELAFFSNAVTALGPAKEQLCVNPLLARASEACCAPTAKPQWATPSPACLYAGERVTLPTASDRCAAQGEELCTSYGHIIPTEDCPHFGFHWTSSTCNVQAKVHANGEAAIVHDSGKPAGQVTLDNPNFFKVNWKDGEYPKVTENCGTGACLLVENDCLCNVTVSESAVFETLPTGAADILDKLHIGHAGPDLYGAAEYTMVESNGYRYYSADGSCCSAETVFEVTDANGQTRFLRNAVSQVSVEGTAYNFRNPPQFNSVIQTEYSVTDAEQESEALLDHLFFHHNTAPFVAFRMIQRFGFSNPSPRYVQAVAVAFREGMYSSDGTDFGTGKYGDMAATMAAVLLDREARSVQLENDPSHGSLREPILKVLGLLRAMQFESNVPLVDLDRMQTKVGQMVYDQPTVFSFFRPEYSAPGAAMSARLASPEAEVMSAGKVVGLLNGMFSLVDNGLSNLDNGFGHYSLAEAPSGAIKYQPIDATNRADTVSDLALLLTGGRLSAAKRDVILQATKNEPNNDTWWRTAVKLLTTTPEFHTTNKANTVQAEDAQAPRETFATNGEKQRYKAVIHLTLQGGCDSFNMLVPHPTKCSALYQEYKKIRAEVALSGADLLPIDGDTTGQPCSGFGLHDQLPILKELYDDGDLTFLANTGVLTELVDKNNFGPKTETQLFAHNSMQEEVDVLDPKNMERGTGSLGRMADAAIAAGYRSGRAAVEVPPRNLAGRLEAIAPIFVLDQGEVTPLDVDLSSPVLRDVMDSLNGESLNAEQSGVFGGVWSEVLGRSLNITEKVFYLLQSNTPTQTVFTENNNLASRFKLISQLVSVREQREVDRDFFTVRYEGFDNHGEVLGPLYDRFGALNDALTDLVKELKLLGVWDDVVIVETSDFGRTLTPNSGGGSDHGWGGNYFIAGGGVKGNRIVGDYLPSFDPDGDLMLSRGRVVPTTPWESPFNAIGEWMGVSDKDLDRVLPNRASFPSLFHSNDLFE